MNNNGGHDGLLKDFTLKALGLVDAPAEKAFDELTRLAQAIFDAPVALVSIVETDNDRQYFKSQQGLPEPWAEQRQTPLSHSFCQHVVADNAPLVIENAQMNSRVCDNLAIRDLSVHSYLGVPIYSPDQVPVGALCVIDCKPRQWTDTQVRLLQKLGNCVSEAIRLKAALKTSEVLRAEEEKLIIELKHTNEALDQFAYIAAHDLQEPLRKIVSFGQLLDNECGKDLNEDGIGYLHYVVDGAQRMQALIRDLLEFSRIQAQEFELSEVSATTALENALLNLEGAVADSNAIITADEMPTVFADLPQLTQLLQNLIGNGIKFCEGPAKIHIGISEMSDHYTISVADNGIGIAPEFHEQIFGIFKRLHGRKKYSGTGIGLAICSRIIERWQQKIWLTSAEGCGTTVHFTVAKTKTKSIHGEAREVTSGLALVAEHGGPSDSMAYSNSH